MGILLDLVIIAIIILNVVIEYKKGLMNVMVNILAFLIAIIATLILYKPISMIIINKTTIDDTIKETIINKANGVDNQNNLEENIDQNLWMENYIMGQIEEQTKEAQKEVIEIIAETISIKAVELLTGLILFIAIRMVLILLKFFTDIITKIPIIEQINGIGGAIYGAIKAIIIIYIILTLLFFVTSINGEGMIQETIDSSYISKFLFNNNIIINYCLLGKNLL